MAQAFSVVTVTLEDRSDGGLRVSSDDLPGLILSGDSRANVAACIAPAIEALLQRRGITAVVHPARPMALVLAQKSPRDIDMHVHHTPHASQYEQFVVEVKNAA